LKTSEGGDMLAGGWGFGAKRAPAAGERLVVGFVYRVALCRVCRVFRGDRGFYVGELVDTGGSLWAAWLRDGQQQLNRSSLGGSAARVYRGEEAVDMVVVMARWRPGDGKNDGRWCLGQLVMEL
jgi:hypothetical protein